MAKATRVSVAARNAALDAITALLPAGRVDIRSGTKPADVATAPSDGAVLASITLNTPAFDPAAAASASVDLAPALSDPSADASGTPTWFRAYTSGGTAVLDGTVGLAAGTPNMVIDTDDGAGNARITAGQVVNMISWSLSLPDTGL